MISLDKRFVFIHIPKTAGSSVSHVLEDDSCIYRENQWDKKARFNVPLNHLTLNQIVNSAPPIPDRLEKYFKFAFVRNPWDKVISECFCGQIQLIFKNCNTVKDKIKVVCALADKGYGNHCKNQLAFIKAPMPMDFIGKFENLHEDFNFVCDQVGINQQVLPVKNKSNHKSYTEYYDRESIDWVRKSYEKDIEHFGYTFGE